MNLNDSEGTIAISLVGLVAIYGPARTGKTTALAALGQATGLQPYRYREPLEPRNMHWPELRDLVPRKDSDEESIAGSENEDASEYPEGGVVELMPQTIYLVDSLRDVLFSSGGTTLKGGISSEALRTLTDIHNDLVAMNSGMLAVINPIYPETGASSEHWSLAMELISGSIGGLFVVRPSDSAATVVHRTFFSVPDRRSDPGPWRIERDRFDQMQPLLDFFTSLPLEG